MRCEKCKERPAVFRGIMPPWEGKYKNLCSECLPLTPLDMNDPEDKALVKKVTEQLEEKEDA